VGTCPTDNRITREKLNPSATASSRRLQATAAKARLFAPSPKRNRANQPLSDAEYDAILHVGAWPEHDFLVYNSLANPDFALSTPDPMMKISDVCWAEARCLP